MTTFLDPLRLLRNPRSITAGPDGNLWVVGGFRGAARATTLGGLITVFDNLFQQSGTTGHSITTGPDGALWYTTGNTSSPSFTHQIGRMTILGLGTVIEFDSSFSAGEIVTGSDGHVWFIKGQAPRGSSGRRPAQWRAILPLTGLVRI